MERSPRGGISQTRMLASHARPRGGRPRGRRPGVHTEHGAGFSHMRHMRLRGPSDVAERVAHSTRHTLILGKRQSSEYRETTALAPASRFVLVPDFVNLLINIFKRPRTAYNIVT